MPTYDYKCTKCEKMFEKTVSIMHRDRPASCACGGVGKRCFMPSFQLPPNRFPYVHHLLDKEPILMTSRRQEAAEFKKRGAINGN